MLARCLTFALVGLEPVPVTVEVDVTPGLPSFTIVGLGDAAVRESRERVRAAMLNSGFEFPLRRIVANLAPASVRKAGPGFDAAIAAGLLAASGQVPLLSLDGTAVFGELSLGGEMRGCRGTLAAAEGAVSVGVSRLFVAADRAQEAVLAGGVEVGAVADLRELSHLLDGTSEPRRPKAPSPGCRRQPGADLAEVRGQGPAVDALSVAAAGGHNLLLQGPPGVGKTMIARRLPSILPAMTESEALEVTRIHSVAGLHDDAALVPERPFRAPHHSVSVAGLVGGGSVPTPGEVTLAHLGVLFLDELSEFPRSVLDGLRQPLEDGFVSIARRSARVVFPAVVTVVAATNPCPCGWYGVDGRCSCDPRSVELHRRRLSGPLLDRFDLAVTMAVPSEDELEGRPAPASASIREKVERARACQAERWAGMARPLNSCATEQDLQRAAQFTPEANSVVREAYRKGLVGPRGRLRLMRTARTVADLDGAGETDESHALRALSLRMEMTGRS